MYPVADTFGPLSGLHSDTYIHTADVQGSLSYQSACHDICQSSERLYTDFEASNESLQQITAAPDRTVDGNNAQSGAKESPGLSLTCGYERCDYQGTFQRPYELDRHIRLKHQQAGSFVCPFRGCFRGSSRSKFARGDKLTAHIRSAHHHQLDSMIQCPVKGCSKPPLEFDLLGIHIRRAHSPKGLINYTELERALMNAASSAYWRCPVQRCCKMMGIASVSTHMLSHSHHDLELVAGDALLQGHRFVRQASTSLVQPAVNGGRPAAPLPPIVAIQVICPVCNIACDDHASFVLHLNEIHLVRSEEKEHYHLWRNGVTTYVPGCSETSRAWTSWRANRYAGKLICNACKIPGCSKQDRYDLGHHLSMQIDVEDIRPYCRGILKMYPDFYSHPVFNDIT